MPFREYPLLNTPSMVLVILREAAGEGPATIAGCVAHLRALLDQAREHPPFGRTRWRAGSRRWCAILPRRSS